MIIQSYVHKQGIVLHSSRCFFSIAKELRCILVESELCIFFPPVGVQLWKAQQNLQLYAWISHVCTPIALLIHPLELLNTHEVKCLFHPRHCCSGEADKLPRSTCVKE